MPTAEEITRIAYQAYIDVKYPSLVNHPDPKLSNDNAFDRIANDYIGERIRSHWRAVGEAVKRLYEE